MRHYVPYASTDELIARIRHYADRPEEARAIAREGAAHLGQRYVAGKFWERVVERLGPLASLPSSI